MSTLHICTVDGASPVGELLDLIARKAPLMMRCGGGHLPQEQPQRHRHASVALTSDEKQRITMMLHKGMPLCAITRAVGRRWGTVKAYIEESEK